MPSTLHWRTEFATGMVPIDNEHRWMFLLTEHVLTSCVTPDRAVVGRALLELYRHTRIHFDHEEAAMRLHHYPEAEEHIRLHEQLMGELDRLACPELDCEARIAGLRYLVVDWASQHIAVADRAFALFLSQNALVHPSRD